MEEATDPLGIPNEPAPEARTLPYAGRLRRIAAYLLDTVLATTVSMFFSGYMTHTLVLRSLGEDEVGVDWVSLWNTMGASWQMMWAVALVVSTGPLYFAVMESSPWQATFGKRLLGIYVTDDRYRRINTGHSLRRSFLKAIIPGILQLAPFLVTDSRKAIHDFAARTLVLSGRTEHKLQIWQPLAAFGISIAWITITFLGPALFDRPPPAYD